MRSPFIALHLKDYGDLLEDVAKLTNSVRLAALHDFWTGIEKQALWEPWEKLNEAVNAGDYDDFAKKFQNLLISKKRV